MIQRCSYYQLERWWDYYRTIAPQVERNCPANGHPNSGTRADIYLPELIEEIVTIYNNYPTTLHTEVLVASIRDPIHLIEAAKLGADVATVPPAVLRKLAQHPLTDKGLAAFLADWKKTGQSILA